MESRPLISVIVPVYNTAQFLERCVDSILKQTYRNLEVILVDDGSTDNSGVLCDNYKDIDDRVKVIHKKNGGLSSARNVGIDNASGVYVGFVDSDDWIEEGMYESLYEGLKNNNCMISCCGRYDVYETSGRMKGLCPICNEMINGEECVGRLLTWDNIDSSACDKLFDKKLYDYCRFPEGKLSEDVAIMYKVILKADNVCLIREPYYNYYHRQDSITTSRFSEKKLHMDEHSKAILNYISAYYPRIVNQARFFRYKELIYLYDCIVRSHMDKEKGYKDLLSQYSKEIGQYKNLVKEFDIDRNRKSYILKINLMRWPTLYAKAYGLIYKIKE